MMMRTLLWMLFKVSFVLFIVNFKAMIIEFLLVFMHLLFAVAFYTLWERKILGAMQRRSGPNHEGLYGTFQPIWDALKLMTRELVLPTGSDFILFAMTPFVMLMCSTLPWVMVSFDEHLVFVDLELGVLFLFALSSLVSLGVILAGWSSNSKYAFLGAARAAAQLISYEIVMGLSLLPMLLHSGSLNIVVMVNEQQGIWNVLPNFFSFMVFFFCILAETNRSPFDLPESESELVSGFNVEYSGVTFVLFFLSEYFSMFLLSIITVMFFFGGWLPLFGMPTGVSFCMKLFFVSFTIVWMRGVMPRFSYDQLMHLCWKTLFPLALLLLFLTLSFYALFGVFTFIFFS